MFIFVAAAALLAQPTANPPAATPPAVQSPAATPAPAAAARFSVNSTRISDILANPAAKAILDRHLPGVSTHPQIGAAGGMTLKAVQPFSQGQITDAHLEAIERDFAALAAE